MAAMMLMLLNFNNAHATCTVIIAAISWPTPLISQLFSPKIFAAPFFSQLSCFVCIVSTAHYTKLKPLNYSMPAIPAKVMPYCYHSIGFTVFTVDYNIICAPYNFLLEN